MAWPTIIKLALALERVDVAQMILACQLVGRIAQVFPFMAQLAMPFIVVFDRSSKLDRRVHHILSLVAKLPPIHVIGHRRVGYEKREIAARTAKIVSPRI
jgi:hypothetical protein